MGLDMYLYRRPRKDEDVDEINLGYWRKANAIHEYFTRNLTEDEEDNCTKIRVKKKDLLDLQRRCLKINRVGADVAEELLPTTSGFFFGGTEYDEYYMQYIAHTLGVVEETLDDWQPNDYVYYFAWY
jgi:hypothetical protein